MLDENTEAVDRKIPSVHEIFQPERYHEFSQALGRCTTELAEVLNRTMARTKAEFFDDPAASKEEIAQYYYIKAIEHLSDMLLSYMLSEVSYPTNKNSLESMTIATPSENLFCNIGVVAMDAVLNFHNAAHYLMGVSYDKLSPSSTDKDFEQFVHERAHCNCIEDVLSLLSAAVPEIAQTPAPTDTVQ